MKRRFLFLSMLIFPVLTLFAQETGAKEPEKPDIFSLALILEKAEVPAQGAWQPDWPLELPLDAFFSGGFDRCSLEAEGFSLSYSLDSGGRPVELPFLLNGAMVQVNFVYRELSGQEFQEISIASPSGEALWNLEILEYRNSYPYIVRVTNGKDWFFIYFSRGINNILETWYDPDGVYLGAFGLSLAETGKDRRTRAILDYSQPLEETEYFYDSRLFITEISGPGGVHRVFYFREKLPRYWERMPETGEAAGGKTDDSAADNSKKIDNSAGIFYLQWDEGGFLTRISCLTGGGEGSLAESRYEYTLDERGNWVERREIRMIRKADLLVPAQGTAYRRVLGYSE